MERIERMIVFAGVLGSLVVTGLGFLWFLTALDQGQAGCASACRERGTMGWSEAEGCICEEP